MVSENKRLSHAVEDITRQLKVHRYHLFSQVSLFTANVSVISFRAFSHSSDMYHLQDGEKHRKDLEEAIFYLQDEIIKNKPKPVSFNAIA